jgi:hypothetical protein
MMGDALLHLGHPPESALELYASAAGMLAQQCGGGASRGEHMRQLRLKMQRVGGPAARRESEGRQRAAASGAGSVSGAPPPEPPPRWQASDGASASDAAPAAAAPGAWRWRRASSPIQLVSCQNGRASRQPPAQAGGGAGLAGALWRLGAQLVRGPAPGGAAAQQRAAAGADSAATVALEASAAESQSFGTACSRSGSPAESLAQLPEAAEAELLALAASAGTAPADAAPDPAAAPALDPAAALSSQLARPPAQPPAQASREGKVDQWLSSCDDQEAWQQHLQRLALLQGPGQGTPGWCTPATASSAVSRSSSAAWSGTLVSPR